MRHQRKSALAPFAEYLEYLELSCAEVVWVSPRHFETPEFELAADMSFSLEFSRKDSFLTMDSARVVTRWLIFAAWILLSLLLFARPVLELIQLANHDETASHILLIPFITAWLLYSERTRTQSQVGVGFAIQPALLFFFPSLMLGILALNCQACSTKTRLSGYVLSLVFFLVAGFIFALGAAAAKSSGFALAFLLFAVPIPDQLLGKIIYGLQAGSAAIAELIFNLSGAPVLRQGFVFRLPVMSIEVAQECSGIRSSLALLILALLVSHFSFRPLWKKLAFVIAGLCMMLVKNGIRIATLTLLANYVNPSFLTGRLHHQGGIVFFLIGLALLVPVYWALRKGEVRPSLVALQQE
jgi:exosortase